MNKKQDKISMTREQFNKLNSIFTNAWDAVKAAFAATEPAFRFMSSKAGRTVICLIANNLTKARDAFLESGELLQNVKDNYMKEISNESINKERAENINNKTIMPEKVQYILQEGEKLKKQPAQQPKKTQIITNQKKTTKDE
jgi:hypothetical protein